MGRNKKNAGTSKNVTDCKIVMFFRSKMQILVNSQSSYVLNLVEDQTVADVRNAVSVKVRHTIFYYSKEGKLLKSIFPPPGVSSGRERPPVLRWLPSGGPDGGGRPEWTHRRRHRGTPRRKGGFF